MGYTLIYSQVYEYIPYLIKGSLLSFALAILSFFGGMFFGLVFAAIRTFGPNYLNKIVIGWIGALIMAIFGFLLFNLIALHFYLIASEQTTYQFLQKRKKEE